MSTPTWFITGASNGFGLLLCLRALQAKHRVIGSMRNMAKSPAAVEKIQSAGGKVIEMDMTESRASIFEKAQKIGPIDYLVNNAGYGLLGAFEVASEDEIENQTKTNCFGPVYLMQAVLGGMRARRSGTIINVSSIAAKDPQACSAGYAGCKAFLEAASEALAHEVAPLGIDVLIVEPGAFRTNFLGATQPTRAPLPDDYADGPVAATLAKFAAWDGRQPGDPAKAVERIFEAATGEQAGEGGTSAAALKGKVLRLVLGEDALARIKTNNEKFVRDFTMCEEVAKSTGF
ncbi:putative short-chain dehydrogenase [Xylariaceae sp. FL0804]|nr:putative short-chain dehydrogenase [Xylariaceae sp. FL0804]